MKKLFEYQKSYAKLSYHGNRLYIDDIFTPLDYRGQGWASKVLEQVCDYADELDKMLYLIVVPGAKEGEGPCEKKLTAWYKRFGFREYNALVLEREPSVMRREPVVNLDNSVENADWIKGVRKSGS